MIISYTVSLFITNRVGLFYLNKVVGCHFGLYKYSYIACVRRSPSRKKVSQHGAATNYRTRVD